MAITRIDVNPLHPQIDQPLEIIVSNLPPRAETMITASLKSDAAVVFSSTATFLSNEQGIVNLTTQAPISGSYVGVDPMGLFWSMTPENPSRFVFDGTSIDTLMEVTINKNIIASKTISRTFSTSDIEAIKIHDESLFGEFFLPKNKNNVPGIVIVPGSGGKIPRTMAQLLATRGYAVFAIAYFGVDGLPKSLENVPLEYFQNAIRYLKNQESVNKNKIGIIGISRGAEGALLFTSLFPDEVNALIACVPSSVVNGGFPHPNIPAWLYQNSPYTPFMSGLSNDSISLTETEDLEYAVKEGIIQSQGNLESPYDLTSLFLARKNKKQDKFQTASIPVENIRCPILLISGEQDKIWPSTLYSKLIMERLDENKSKISKSHLSFANAGHGFFSAPYLPAKDQPIFHQVGKFWCLFGGTAEGNANASKESWEEANNFLQQKLKS